MTETRKTHSADFKKEVVLEALKQQKTIKQIVSEYGVHATQVTNWKKIATEAINQAFVDVRKQIAGDQQAELSKLHRQLEQAIAERDWLKKKSLNIH